MFLELGFDCFRFVGFFFFFWGVGLLLGIMVMAENETEVKSPWKTPVIDGEKAADVPVMGTQSWPDLSSTQQTPDNTQVAADGSAPASSVEQVG